MFAKDVGGNEFTQRYRYDLADGRITPLTDGGRTQTATGSGIRPRTRSSTYLNELGVAIVFPNVRGSTAYGKTFVKLDNGLQREGWTENCAKIT